MRGEGKETDEVAEEDKVVDEAFEVHFPLVQRRCEPAMREIVYELHCILSTYTIYDTVFYKHVTLYTINL